MRRSLLPSERIASYEHDYHEDIERFDHKIAGEQWGHASPPCINVPTSSRAWYAR